MDVYVVMWAAADETGARAAFATREEAEAFINTQPGCGSGYWWRRFTVGHPEIEPEEQPTGYAVGRLEGNEESMSFKADALQEFCEKNKPTPYEKQRVTTDN